MGIAANNLHRLRISTPPLLHRDRRRGRAAGYGQDRRLPPQDYAAFDAGPTVAAPFRASMALTEFSNAVSKTRLPIVLSTKPSNRPLRFLPSRTMTASMSVMPLG